MSKEGSFSNYLISCMVWENEQGRPNDIMMNDSLPYKVWNRRTCDDDLNDEFKVQFKNYGHHTYFMIIYRLDNTIIETKCTSMDDEYDLKSLFSFLRLIND